MLIRGFILEGQQCPLNLLIRARPKRCLQIGNSLGVISAADIFQVGAAIELQLDELADDGDNAVGVPAAPAFRDDCIARFEAHDTSLHGLTADADRVYSRRMGTSLDHYLAAVYRPSLELHREIDADRHPHVFQWVTDHGSYDKPHSPGSMGWLSGYKQFPDLFERAAYLTPSSPTNSLADMWNLVGWAKGNFTPTTLGWFTMVMRPGSSALPNLVATRLKLGNAPDNLFDQNEWARGGLTSWMDVKQTLKSYPQAVLGGIAKTWEPDNIDELMAYNVKRREVNALVDTFYPGVNFDSIVSEATVPFEIVRAGLIEKMPVEYLSAML